MSQDANRLFRRNRGASLGKGPLAALLIAAGIGLARTFQSCQRPLDTVAPLQTALGGGDGGRRGLMVQKSSPGLARARIGSGHGIEAGIDLRLDLINLRST